MADPAKPRRPLRYSLRTLFLVVTLLGAFLGWLSWELASIREREAYLRWTMERTHTIKFVHFDGPFPAVPFWRRWLGDHAQNHVLIPSNSTAADVEQAQALFPEALWIEVEEPAEVIESESPDRESERSGSSNLDFTTFSQHDSFFRSRRWRSRL